MLCVPVPSNDVERQWKLMLQFLRPAIERSNGRWTPEDVFRELAAGTMQCWVLIEGPLLYGVGVTSIRVYPGLKSLECMWLGGVDSHLWMQLLDETVSRWAISEGCTRMEIAGRKGWERMGAAIGFRPSYVFFEKELSHAGKDVEHREDHLLNGAATLAVGSLSERRQHGDVTADSA